MNAAITTTSAAQNVFAAATEKAAEMSAPDVQKRWACGTRIRRSTPSGERREWIRRMLQGHYELRGAVERAVCPRGRDGVLRTSRRRMRLVRGGRRGA
jgi:hypothetical protein